MKEWTSTPLRTAALVLGVIAAVTMFYLYNPWWKPTGDIRNLTTWTFWIGSIGLIVALFLDRKDAPESDEVEVEGPAFARFLFSNRRAALVWLPIRLFVGFTWLDAGWHKLTGTGWTDGGASLLGYWTNAVKVPAQGAGSPPITFEWYRGFLQLLIDNNAQGWFAWLITLGELAVGLGLLFGALTGIAAFFGALMNMSFLLAGSSSTNPVLFTFAVGLILAWRVAGYYGVDRYLLPRLGTPWHAKVSTHPMGAPRAAGG
jgi:thiosulfate dehydrogenase [quinone] large subunit